MFIVCQASLRKTDEHGRGDIDFPRGPFATPRRLQHASPVRFPVRFETACFVITHDVPEQAMPWFKRARDIFGRLLIFIDARRAVPGAEQRAREVASFVHPSVSEAFFASDFRAMAAACESDWALYQIGRAHV